MKKLLQISLIILIMISYITPVQAAEAMPSASQMLIEKATTTGDGLKKDEFEEDRYIFQGENVNNYLTFNNETAGWRIISVEKDGSLKIIKTDSIGQMAFDTENLRNNEESGTYCYVEKPTIHYGCNAWAATENLVGTPSEFTNGEKTGTVLKDAEINTTLNTTYYNSLTEDAKKYILDYNFSVGGTDPDSELSEQTINNEKEYLWKGKIGLINYSDISRIQEWLVPSTDEEILTLTPIYNNYTFIINLANLTYENISKNIISTAYAQIKENIHPVVYISGDIAFTGDGTKENPYTIANTIKINYEVLGDLQFMTFDNEYLLTGSTLDILKRQEFQNGNQVCSIEDWYLDQELTTKLDTQTPINNDLTLYSKWNCREVITVPNTSITIPIWVIYLGLGLIITGGLIIFIIMKKKNKKIEE